MAACAASPAALPVVSAALDPVVITASRSPEPLSAVLGDMSVIDRTAIERSGAIGVADLLARQPGIEFARSGGPTAATSVFLRGAETRHTAVYLDGVRLDSQSTGGAAWEQIPLDQIERIEVLRGPAAAAYGSDAVAGVVQLFTKRGQGKPRTTGAASVGRYGLVRLQAGVSGATSSLDYAVSASHGRSDGFDARSLPTANPDDDGWHRSAVSSRLGFALDPRHRVEATLLASHLRSQYDSTAADDVAHHALGSSSLAWRSHWNEQSQSNLQLGQTQSRYETRPTAYRTETTLSNLTFQHEQQIGMHKLGMTLERREDRLNNPATASTPSLQGRRHQDAIGFGWRTDVGRHGFQAQVRRDEDSEFGGRNTGSLAWGWAFMPEWRVTAAAGTSFRVPTLYQRYSQYGNAELSPETGRNVEFGLRWSRGSTELGLTGWRNRIDDLITFGPGGPCGDALGCYANIGRARLSGVTLSGRSVLASVTARGSIDWHDPKNLDTGNVLPRRARRFATLGAETSRDGWLGGVELQFSGARYDNASNTQRLGGYGLWNLFVSKQLAPAVTVEGRIDNVGNKAYETARTYANARRSGQVSLRWTTQ